MKTNVVHCKKEQFDVYIGRGSKWGNPFTHKKKTSAEYIVGSRDEAVNAYELYLTQGAGQHLLKDIRKELKGKTLGCWCSPQACHGDILAKFADLNVI